MGGLVLVLDLGGGGGGGGDGGDGHGWCGFVGQMARR